MNSKVKDILEWIICIVIAFALALIIKHYLITPTIVKQISMYPTLQNNDRLLLNRWARTTKQTLQRGEIITFEAPSVKRYLNIEDVNINNPIATYDSNEKGLLYKFFYYVVEISKESYIKRVIGLPGEHVVISDDGDVFINDIKIEENYLRDGLKTKKTGLFYDLVVPDGYVFVMGDNRDHSTDSREFGCIPIDKVEGKVICRFWPLQSIGKVK